MVKRCLGVSMIIFFIQLTFSQADMSAATRADLKSLFTLDEDHVQEIQHLPIYTMNNEKYISLIAKTNDSFSVTSLKEEGVIVGATIKDIISLKVPVKNVERVIHQQGITHVDIAHKIQPQMDRIDYDTRLDSVKMAIDLPQEYTGKGVYIGFLDWGFDYTHPNYYDTLIENYRVAAAWDQFKQSGPAPQGFTYGTEYVGAEDLLMAASDTSNIYGYAYHGGHVAGISAGGGAGTDFRGVAYESEMLFATFLVDAAAVIDAYEWMYQKAQEAGKRLVINQSWGLYYMGTLDGSSLLSQAINNYSDLGVVFTSSAGNNGNTNFHIEKSFNGNDTLWTGIDFSTTTSPHYWGQSISAWGSENEPFSIGFQVYSAGQQLIGESEWFSSTTTIDEVDTFLVIGNDTVYYQLVMEEANPFNNRPSARLKVKRTTEGFNLVLKLTAEAGKVHAWNLAELTTGVGNMGTAFTFFGPNSVGGDNHYGVGEPACAESVIAVASHAPGYLGTNDNLVGGSISSFSSYGPLYTGALKPDLSAPGGSIGSSISSFADASFSFTETVDFNGKTYGFSRLSGTSMSSPVVAGIVALMLEANPYLTASDVKTILLNSTYQDVRTGTIGPDGDTRWGWGKVDAYNAIKGAIEQLSIQEVKQPKKEVVVYPNPSVDQVRFKNATPNQMVYVYNNNGQLICNELLEGNQLNITDFPKGIYLVKLSASNAWVRVVKE